MKIHSTHSQNTMINVYNNAKKSSEVKNSPVGSLNTDTLELSGAAKTIAAMMKDAKDESEISERAMVIKEQLQIGTYRVSSQSLAESLLDVIRLGKVAK
ncbi:MAG: flagellar biosynthesis anti-sigma factor FlgM [Erysipelotrichaceae bacterium]|nr:flagellar biosynthesis anti-sigma factor FlgM [Erysipelotrichaceae bacterium]